MARGSTEYGVAGVAIAALVAAAAAPSARAAPEAPLTAYEHALRCQVTGNCNAKRHLVPSERPLCFATPDKQLNPVAMRIGFANGSSELLPKSRAELGHWARVLKTIGCARFAIAGHTNSVGPAALNDSLSQRRALTVKDFLKAGNVPEGAMSARGYGSSQPRLPDPRDPRNRRVEITVSVQK